MKKFNSYRSLGLLFSMISIISNRFGLLPDIVEGMCLGLGIVLLLMAAYSYNHDMSSFRNRKMSLIKKYWGQN